jgi:hypothetical protein
MSTPTINLALEFTSDATEARTAREWATLEFNTNLFQLANDTVSASGYRFIIADMFAGSTADFQRCNNQAGTTVFSIGSGGCVKSTGVKTAIDTKTADYTVTVNDHSLLGDCSGGNVTFSLPNATTCAGQIFYFQRIAGGGNDVNIDPNGTQTIDGSSTTLTLTSQWDRLVIQSDGSNWHIITSLIS